MDDERKRQLKRRGKRIIARRSARVRRAMLRANPYAPSDPRWADAYRAGVERDRELRDNTTRVLGRELIGHGLEVLEIDDDPTDGPPAAVHGVYAQCDECHDLVPTAASQRLSCRCGLLQHGPTNRGDRLPRLHGHRLCKLVGTGDTRAPRHAGDARGHRQYAPDEPRRSRWRRAEVIGRGFEPGDAEATHPYTVRVLLDAPEQPIGLSEGRGFAGAGGAFTLQDMLDPRWDDHLRICGCLWLRQLAREEQEAGRRLTADEILSRWSER